MVAGPLLASTVRDSRRRPRPQVKRMGGGSLKHLARGRDLGRPGPLNDSCCLGKSGEAVSVSVSLCLPASAGSLVMLMSGEAL